MILARRVMEVFSPSSCNCLLSSYPREDDIKVDVVAGCYEFFSSSDGLVGDRYGGSITGYACELSKEHRLLLREKASTLGSVRSVNFPGVFDLTACNGEHNLMASCTDGSVRLLKFERESFEELIFPVHNTMLTSCSPFYLSSGGVVGQVKWLCTAHQGAVMIYDPIRKTIISSLEKHDYDAWCSAMIGQETALSGGDDGFLKLHDIRCGESAVGRMRFGAGVVSVAPVAEGGVVTSYSLVGSYDENLYLVDLRSQKRPLASVALGGGVWRCSRQLFAEELTPGSEAAMHYSRWVQPCNALVIPVMQRGVALVRYDIGVSEEKNFLLLGHLHDKTSSTNVADLPSNALFYDCAVLHQPLLLGEDGLTDTTAVVTCDFYNKKITLWEVSGIRCTA